MYILTYLVVLCILMLMNEDMKRVSLLLRKTHQDQLADLGINVSRLVRDMIDDYLSDHKVTLSVTEETHHLYAKVLSKTGAGDDEFEPFLVKALDEFLKHKIEEMKELHMQLKKEG